MRRHRIGWAALGVAVLLAACQQGKNTGNGSEEDQALPVPVETATPIRGDIYAIYSGTAPIEAFAEADVIAKVEGEVREVLVEEGDDVKKNQVLARLDGERLRLELSESQARLRKLQSEFQRNRELKDKGLLSEGDFEKIQYELEALQASYNLASLELDYTQIRAPIDGVVSERYIKLGNTIKVGDPIFRVTSFEPLVAYLYVPEREYRQLEPGQPVAIDIDALDGARVITEVTRVSPIVEPGTGTFKVTIEISDPERRIKPGMFARMSIVYDRHADALQVPRSAIVEELGAASVFVVEDDVAVRKPVETGFGEAGMIEIVSGLDSDDRVIIVGQVGLKAAARVTVINAAVDEAGAPATETGPDGESADAETIADGDQ